MDLTKFSPEQLKALSPDQITAFLNPEQKNLRKDRLLNYFRIFKDEISKLSADSSFKIGNGPEFVKKYTDDIIIALEYEIIRNPDIQFIVSSNFQLINTPSGIIVERAPTMMGLYDENIQGNERFRQFVQFYGEDVALIRTKAYANVRVIDPILYYNWCNVVALTRTAKLAICI